MNDAKALRIKLKAAGLSKAAIDAAWPAWWSDEAAASPSATAELRFSVSRKLGLSPRSLFDEGDATFVWSHNAKFKSYKGESSELAAIVGFANSFARTILTASPATQSIAIPNAIELRSALLKSNATVDLAALVAACWSLGIPVVHLRVMPLAAKRLAAMAVRVTGQSVIFLAKDFDVPAPAAFYVAHELGHLSLGHVPEDDALVDMGDVLETATDQEEFSADEFALELLTGSVSPAIETQGAAVNGKNLAAASLAASGEHQIDAGTIALCYGHQSGNWPATWSAMKHIYSNRAPVWKFINNVAKEQLDLSLLSSDVADYVETMIGADELG